MERFACGTTVISGEGALEILAEDAGKRLLVVTDPGIRETSLIQWVLDQAKPVSTAFFDAVAPEAAVRQAMDGAHFLEAGLPEMVVGIGGGNVLNCAKAMVGFAKYRCCLTLIPTAVGTGAEAGDCAVLFHDDRFHNLRGAGMGAQRVILDGRFLQGKPQRQLAEEGFSLLAVSLESYASKNAGLLTGMYAREAFATGWAVLPAALSGRLWALRRLQMASMLSSVAADQAGGGLCGALCGSLRSVFRLRPGRVEGIILPAVMEFNAAVSGTRYAELARSAGMGGSTETLGVRNLRNGLVRLRKELGLPGTLAQAGLPPAMIWNRLGKILELTLEDHRCRNNPVPVDDYMVRRILDAAAG